MSIQIIITDDHPLVVSGLEIILKPVAHIEVMATYFSGDDLMEGLKAGHLPDVLLTDLQMPGKLFGIDLVRALRRLYPDLPLLILSGQETLFSVTDVMEQGCRGYLLKNTATPEMLVQAIEAIVYKGDIFLEPALKDELLRTILKRKKENEETARIISRREAEVLQLLVEGLTSQEIADKLYLSIRTIESHRMRLLQKLGARNVVDMINKAKRLNLLP